MDISPIHSLKKILEDKTKKIVLVSHVNPDGDAVGSSLGFYLFLKNDLHENVVSILPGGFPSFLAWLPGADSIIIADKEKEKACSALENADIVFCLDFNDTDRTAVLADSFKKTKGIKILIDHHPDPKDQFDFRISTTQVSSTAELIYEVILGMNKQHLIDLDVAQCLYTGIVTDTGSFSYACNYPRTYYIIGHFMNLGLNGEQIHRQIYDTYSEDRLRLLGHSLSKNLKVLEEYHAAYIFLYASDLENFNYQEGDSEGIVNYALSIKGIHLAAIFIEREDQVKISFRSEGEVNVNVLARKYYRGGGHKNAAGGSSKKSLDSIMNEFEDILKEISKDDFRLLKDV